jgi:uncharacterized repeat protein (TIGR02543 family)
MTRKKKLSYILLTLCIFTLISCVLFLVLQKKFKHNYDNTTTTTTTQVTTTKQVEETITITFDSNGGTEVKPMVVKKGEKVTLPKPTKKGYEFNGWLTDNDDMPNDVTSFDKNTKLTANWKPVEKKSMKVTFDSREGSTVKAKTYECKDGGATITLPANPTKDFYEFRVWEDKNGTPILDGALLTCEDVTLYAVWDYDGPEANTEH